MQECLQESYVELLGCKAQLQSLHELGLIWLDSDTKASLPAAIDIGTIDKLSDAGGDPACDDTLLKESRRGVCPRLFETLPAEGFCEDTGLLW